MSNQYYDLSYRYWTHACSALVFATLRDYGQDFIAKLEQDSVHRHQKLHFLSGLAKLGLDRDENDVRKCARYHFFSNSIGGLPMHYVEESTEKIWIRYLAPFWMGDSSLHATSGPAVLGPQFGRAPFLGWHAYNGAFLNNPRLVFVHTQNLVEGDPWDGGYFTLDERSHPPGEGYIRRSGEWGPPPDPSRTPLLPHATWPEERLLKARRTFSIEFMLSRITMLCHLLGTTEAARLTERAFCLMLVQQLPSILEDLGLSDLDSASAAARCYCAVARANGSFAELSTSSEPGRVLERSALWKQTPCPGQEIEQAMANAWCRAIGAFNRSRVCVLGRDGDLLVWDFA